MKPNASDRSDTGWRALGAAGWLFLVVGLTDLVLAWLPPRFGNADWELGTVTTMFNNLPVPAMGVALSLAGTTALKSRIVRRALAVVASVLAVWSLVGAVLFGLTVPVAFAAVTDAVPRQALLTSTIKTTVQILVYTPFFLWAARVSLRSPR